MIVKNMFIEYKTKITNTYCKNILSLKLFKMCLLLI